MLFNLSYAMLVQGWINKPEYVKVLKLVMRQLSATIINTAIFFTNQPPSSHIRTNNLKIITESDINEYKEDSDVVECVIDSLHLLVQASW